MFVLNFYHDNDDEASSFSDEAHLTLAASAAFATFRPIDMVRLATLSELVISSISTLRFVRCGISACRDRVWGTDFVNSVTSGLLL